MSSQKQTAILRYIADGEKTKKQIVNRFGAWHYRNSNKYIGEILTRMVRKGLLVRVEKGLYKRKHFERVEAENEREQISLF